MCDIYVYTHVGVYGCVHSHVCVYISVVIAMKKYHKLKQFGREKGLIWITFPHCGALQKEIRARTQVGLRYRHHICRHIAMLCILMTME